MVEPVNDNILNLVNELYNNLDAKDKIINEQALEIARLNNIINEKDYKIKRIVCSCYESDMSYDEFKRIWVNAFGKLYNSKDMEELSKEILGDKENE